MAEPTNTPTTIEPKSNTSYSLVDRFMLAGAIAPAVAGATWMLRAGEDVVSAIWIGAFSALLLSFPAALAAGALGAFARFIFRAASRRPPSPRGTDPAAP